MPNPHSFYLPKSQFESILNWSSPNSWSDFKSLSEEYFVTSLDISFSCLLSVNNTPADSVQHIFNHTPNMLNGIHIQAFGCQFILLKHNFTKILCNTSSSMKMFNVCIRMNSSAKIQLSLLLSNLHSYKHLLFNIVWPVNLMKHC